MLLLKSLCFRTIPSLARWAGKRHVVVLVAMILGISFQAFGQQATIVGTVTDPSGGVVPSVTVTITHTETGTARTFKTNEAGQYVAPDLQIGHYTAKASASGFKSAEQKDIVLTVGDRIRVDFQMQMGTATETVTVEAAAIHVQTDSGEVSNLITDQQLAQLAVNGTSLFQLAALSPGASSDITNYKDLPVGGDTSVSFNGQRTAHNVFLLDGGEDYDRGCGGCVTTAPSTDAIAEFRQLTSNYSADYGLSSAGTVTMILKSGGSALHASAWEFNRNDAFDARGFFFPAPNKKPELRMNIFGFNVAGPVTFGHLYNADKKKTFFFYNMEWRKYIDGGSTNQSVPDTATYGGDFSSVSTPIMVPSASRVAPSVLFANCTGGIAPAGIVQGSPFPGNKIPSCMIQPNATALLSAGIFPAPTTNIANGVGNFVGGANTPTNLKEEIARIDHNFSDKFSVFGHFIAEQISQGYNTSQWSGDNLPTVGDTFNNPSYSAVIHATHTISPSLINEMAFNYNGNRIHITPFAATGLKSLSLPSGYNGTNSRLFSGPNNMNRIPNITLDGQSGANFQISSWPWVNSANDYQIRDDVSWTKGAHQLKIGGSWALYKKVQDLFGTTQGAFTFTGKANNLTYTGNSFADFLLGTTCAGCGSGYEELAVQDHGLWNNVSWAAYVQDNWRVNKKFTLNLGLRWDGIPHAYEANNRMGNFYPSLYNSANAATFDNFSNICSGPADPGCSAASPGLGTSSNKILAGVPLYLNGIGIPGQNGVPKGLVNNHWATFGPRLGFAYDLTGAGKTVVRGGLGIMYERIQGNDMYNAGSNIPFSLDVQLSSVEFQNPNILLATGAAPAFQTIKAANITGLAIGNYKPPVATQYSAGVQQSFSRKTVLSVSYVGNVNRHLSDYRNINLPPLSSLPAFLASGAPYQVAPGLPYPGFRTLSLAGNEANAHYNSLQVDLNSQIKDLQLRAFYTLSRSIDPSTGGSGQDLNAVSNPYVGWRYDLGPSIFDRTHVASVNFIYDIPLFHHSSSRMVKSTVGGWQISGILTAESGLPINITDGGGNVVGGGNRPNIATISYTRAVLAGTQKIQYFDPAPFNASAAQPAAGAWGTLGHNALRGPGRDNWNLSLFKTFTFSEARGSRFELRLETFNTFNHTQFQGVDAGVGDSRFGQFTSAYPARIVQLAGKLYF